MKKISKYIFLFGFGGTIYYSVEILFRGFSHWTMFVLGGICFLFMYIQGRITGWQDAFWKQLVRSVIFVTAMEFIFGIIINKYLLWDVWDYSLMPLHLFGQICLPFTLIFSVLTAIGILLSSYITYWLYKETKPHFNLI